MRHTRIRVLAIAGSLRRSSFHDATLHAEQARAPAAMTIETFDITPIAR
jgi:NAD(P)H-dependent FMN reductase